MTDQTNDEDPAKRFANWKAVREAEERSLAQARNGALWGAWKPERLVCRACGDDIVHTAQRAAFLDVAELFEHETIAARSIAAYDLMFRKSVDIPDWVHAECELWRHPQHTWADRELDDIIERGTAEDLLGTYADYCRACDSASHVFIRACSNCRDPDPLNLCSELLTFGMEKLERPYEFLGALREDQKARQKRWRDQIEYMEKRASLKPNNRVNNIQPLKDKLAAPDSRPLNQSNVYTCHLCGSKRDPKSKFCGGCGRR